MKRDIQTRPVSFIANLIRFAIRIRQTFEILSHVDQFIPGLKKKVSYIDTNRIGDFILCVDKYFNLDVKLDENDNILMNGPNRPDNK